MTVKSLFGSVKRAFEYVNFETGYLYDDDKRELYSSVRLAIEGHEMRFEYDEWEEFAHFLEDLPPLTTAYCPCCCTVPSNCKFRLVEAASENGHILFYSYGMHALAPKSIYIRQAAWNELVTNFALADNEVRAVENLQYDVNDVVYELTHNFCPKVIKKMPCFSCPFEEIFPREFSTEEIEAALEDCKNAYVRSTILEIVEKEPEIITNTMTELTELCTCPDFCTC